MAIPVFKSNRPAVKRPLRRRRDCEGKCSVAPGVTVGVCGPRFIRPVSRSQFRPTGSRTTKSRAPNANHHQRTWRRHLLSAAQTRVGTAGPYEHGTGALIPHAGRSSSTQLPAPRRRHQSGMGICQSCPGRRDKDDYDEVSRRRGCLLCQYASGRRALTVRGRTKRAGCCTRMATACSMAASATPR